MSNNKVNKSIYNETSKTYDNPENGNKYTREYDEDGVKFNLTNGFDTYHDFLVVDVEYPKEVIKKLKANKQVTSNGCVLPPETEERLKDLFLDISFPIKDDSVLAGILWLAVPKGCKLADCPNIDIIIGKEYLEENEVGYEYFTWNITDEIKYTYGERKTYDLTTLSEASEREDKVKAAIMHDVDLSLPNPEFWDKAVEEAEESTKKGV